MTRLEAHVSAQRGRSRLEQWIAERPWPRGSPFCCAQAPCKISLGAAVISSQTGTAAFYPRLVVHKEDNPGAPMTFCEYADGATNNLGIDQVQRVPTLGAAVAAMQTQRNLGIGGTLDCGATGQTNPVSGIVKEIWVPASANGTGTAFYDVSATLGFGGLATEPEDTAKR